MPSYFVIPHDGTMEGDCALDPMTMAEIPSQIYWESYVSVEPYIRKAIEGIYEGDMDPEDIDSEMEEVAGWWIVEESTVELMEEVAAHNDGGSDSGCYEMQAILKTIARHLAVTKVDKV